MSYLFWGLHGPRFRINFVEFPRARTQVRVPRSSSGKTGVPSARGRTLEGAVETDRRRLQLLRPDGSFGGSDGAEPRARCAKTSRKVTAGRGRAANLGRQRQKSPASNRSSARANEQRRSARKGLLQYDLPEADNTLHAASDGALRCLAGERDAVRARDGGRLTIPPGPGSSTTRGSTSSSRAGATPRNRRMDPEESKMTPQGRRFCVEFDVSEAECVIKLRSLPSRRRIRRPP